MKSMNVEIKELKSTEGCISPGSTYMRRDNFRDEDRKKACCPVRERERDRERQRERERERKRGRERERESERAAERVRKSGQ